MLFEKIHLEPDEQIVKIIRKHWFIIAFEFFGLFLLALVPFALELFFFNLPDEFLTKLGDTSGTTPYFVFGTALWLLFIVMAAAAAWTHYYLDLWVVTSRRVILIDQRGFFRRFISSFRLERLQDMNVEINGLIPTLLNFGTVEAQTAGGSNEEFTSHNMPDPRGIKALIIGLADDMTAYSPAAARELREQGL